MSELISITRYAERLNGLYLVTPDWDDTEQLVRCSEAALKGGANLLQYRHKTASPELRLEQARALQAMCKSYSVPFIINDHVDLCLEIDADGLHVGGKDIDVASARAAIGDEKILGASCYGDLALADSATQQGATYIAFGGFYPSRIKKYEVSTPASIVSAGKYLNRPIVVIGGMTLENCRPLIAEGSDMVAVISSVYFESDPEVAARALVQLFA